MSSPAEFNPQDAAAELAPAYVKALQAHLIPGGSALFALIDPMLGDPVLLEPLAADLSIQGLNAVRGDAWGRSIYTLSLPRGVALDAALAPYLVELHGPDDEWLSSTVQWALSETMRTWLGTSEDPVSTPHRIGGWVESAALGPVLAGQLSGWLELRADVATKARYLRLADRRVWSLAVAVLGEQSVALRMGNVQRWHWLDPRAGWRHLQALPVAEPQEPASAIVTFTAEQWATMASGDTLHRLMAEAHPARAPGPGQRVATPYEAVDVKEWQRWIARAAKGQTNKLEGSSS